MANKLCPEYKVLCLGQIQHNTSLSTTLQMFKHGSGCIMLWVCLSSTRTRELFLIKINGIDLSTGEILEENLVVFFPTDTEPNSSSSRTITQNTPILHCLPYNIVAYHTVAYHTVAYHTTLNVEWHSYST